MGNEIVPYRAQRATGRAIAESERTAIVEQVKALAAAQQADLQERADFHQTAKRIVNGFDLGELTFGRSARLYQSGVAAVERCGGGDDVAELVLAVWASVTHAAVGRISQYMNGGR